MRTRRAGLTESVNAKTFFVGVEGRGRRKEATPSLVASSSSVSLETRRDEEECTSFLKDSFPSFFATGVN